MEKLNDKKEEKLENFPKLGKQIDWIFEGICDSHHLRYPLLNGQVFSSASIDRQTDQLTSGLGKRVNWMDDDESFFPGKLSPATAGQVNKARNG